MCGLELAEKIKEVDNPKEKIDSGVLSNVDNLENLSDIGLKTLKIELQDRRGELQEEIEDAIERLKRISETKLERNIPNK